MKKRFRPFHLLWLFAAILILFAGPVWADQLEDLPAPRAAKTVNYLQQEEIPDFEGEPEALTQVDIPEEIAPAAAEELAALVSVQVEEVVTRLVEEQLPSLVERLVAQEIEKIKSSLESGE